MFIRNYLRQAIHSKHLICWIKDWSSFTPTHQLKRSEKRCNCWMKCDLEILQHLSYSQIYHFLIFTSSRRWRRSFAVVGFQLWRSNARVLSRMHCLSRSCSNGIDWFVRRRWLWWKLDNLMMSLNQKCKSHSRKMPLGSICNEATQRTFRITLVKFTVLLAMKKAFDSRFFIWNIVDKNNSNNKKTA